MNLCLFFVLLLFLCLINTFLAASDYSTHIEGDVSVNCGSSGKLASKDGREWHGDVQRKLSSLLQIKGSSTASNVIHKLISADDPVPYETARLSRSRFSYVFEASPGQKILRLHFNPSPYQGFISFKDLFTVEAGSFTLLSNFSASLIANVLGLNSFVKEFCLNIEGNQPFHVVFSPASGRLLDTYAFINGIEIISVPSILSYFHMGDIGVQVVGKSLVYVHNSAALEMIHRVNIKHESVLSAGSTNDMLALWETVTKRKASKINNNNAWKISVDVGFRYLVRLYFSELGFKIAKFGGVIFTVCINEMIVDTNIDIASEKDDGNGVPWYRDYMVMMEGHKEEGKRDLLICLQSDDEFLDGHGPVKGFEIMKLSNLDYSLASPNPLHLARDLSHWSIQNLHQVLGHRNMIATIVITYLASVYIIFFTFRHICGVCDTEEENMPPAKARRLCRQFSLAEIELATRNFSNEHLIGKGGFGNVYKGLIDNGIETVAVKRLKSSSKQGVHEFLTEIKTLTEVRHVNLVSLIGYCDERGEMILVYEYMARGTLADNLYKLARKHHECPCLTWKQRLAICIGAGRGLDYLHTGHSLVHRDVKASNILLDEDFVAKVSDFGFAKRLSRSKLHNHVSTKSDTYAFGVMLLEVLSGRPAVDLAEGEWILSKWARDRISKGKTDQIVAWNLKAEISEDSLRAFVWVVERCLLDEPKKRPTMAQVVAQLEFALEQQVIIDMPNVAPSLKEQRSSEVANGEPSRSRKDSTDEPMIAIRAIPVEELQMITNNFDSKCLVCTESYGRVYHGVMGRGQGAAIIKLELRQPDQEFLAHVVAVSMISSLKHKNLVQLLGYCVDYSLHVLAYEFARHGSLHEILHGQKGLVLSWAQRLKIAVDAAKGLEYIHERGQVHGDINSRNVLIFDDCSVAKIAEFRKPFDGYDVAKIVDSYQARHRMANDDPLFSVYPGASDYDNDPPEYQTTCQRTWMGDVYSFGVVLLELFTGRYNQLTMGLTVDKVKWCLDARVLNVNHHPEAAADKMAAVVVSCLQYEAEYRPNMSIVVESLQSLW